MRILIASGIYPPDIGGPAQYARNLYETWKKQGHDVKVAAYRWERAFPAGVRHILYFLKILRKGWNADLILVLDTWSAAVPAMYACRLMGKKYLIRTGGDFLWESYVERTGDLVLFSNFYGDYSADSKTPDFSRKLSRKERLVFKLSGRALRMAQVVIFSTKWQKDIFERVYGLSPRNTFIVENFCGPREDAASVEGRVFVAGSRQIRLKNIEMLKKAFESARSEVVSRGLPDIVLDTGKAMHENFLEKIRRAYAVIVASISEVSPNIVFDAMRLGVPFIVTRETGIAEKIRNVAIFVDPLDVDDIRSKIVWLADPRNRESQAGKVRAVAMSHSWEEIAKEILGIYKRKY